MPRSIEPPAYLRTAYEAFVVAAERTPDNEFLCIPACAQRDYAPGGVAFTYAQMASLVEHARRRYRASGFGSGHRIGLMLGNRPEYFVQFLACNALGIMVVPLGLGQAAAELAHAISDSRVVLVLAPHDQHGLIEDALACVERPVAVFDHEDLPASFPLPPSPASGDCPDRGTDALLLYTSGTTGRPKGCRVSNDYFLYGGQWYISRGGAMAVRDGMERIFNPLPMQHMNAAVLSLMAAILTSGCVIAADRFHPGTWWKDVVDARATIVHYMGVIPPILMAMDPGEEETRHTVRFGFGAGVAPAVHVAFERRFGFPLVEVWGMTETGRTLTDHIEPRSPDRRAVGRPSEGLEVRIVDAEDRDVPRGQPGELIVRHTAAKPRKGFFNGYLNRPEDTEHAWRGGWFHSGDVVVQEEDGLVVFVDRSKNIIRRSGENISAGEVEAVLSTHPDIVSCAVLAVDDDLREQEVFACVVLREGAPAGEAAARALLDHCSERLSYYKLPGWLAFRQSLPTTVTNKVQHRLIFTGGEDPRQSADCFDLRAFKAAARTTRRAGKARARAV